MKILGDDELLGVVRDVTSDVVTIRWRNKSIQVRKLLSYAEETELVKRILMCCSHIDGDDVSFIPELFDISFRANIVSAYSMIKLPDDLEKQHLILYGTDLYNCILSVANSSQVETIKNIVEYYLDYRG